MQSAWSTLYSRLGAALIPSAAGVNFDALGQEYPRSSSGNKSSSSSLKTVVAWGEGSVL